MLAELDSKNNFSCKRQTDELVSGFNPLWRVSEGEQKYNY